jgi:hypothetical protein
MNGWTVAWILWLAMFAVIELPAILNRDKGDTLSEHVWAWFAVKGKPRGWQWRRLTLIVFLAWLVVHFISGGWI